MKEEFDYIIRHYSNNNNPITDPSLQLAIRVFFYKYNIDKKWYELFNEKISYNYFFNNKISVINKLYRYQRINIIVC